MIKNEVGKGAIYVYIQLISSMISGYIFFIILARITTTEIIGIFSLLLALSEIFGNIAILGLPDGMQRFLGKSFLQNNLSNARLFVKLSLVFLSIGITFSLVLVIFLKDWLYILFGIDNNLVMVIGLLVSSYAIYTILYYIIIATLKTKKLPIIITISSAAKVIMAITLVGLGGGVIGLALGYTFFGQILSAVLLGILIMQVFKPSAEKLAKSELKYRNASKDLLKAGVASWIPLLITTLGIDLGTLVLYGAHGPYQSGIYFLTLAILNALTAITYAIFTISLPALSSMEDGRKRFSWHTIRLSSILLLPLTISIFFYPDEIMRFFGNIYVVGSSSLQILLLSTFPIIVSSGIDALVFAYGRYRHAMAINLAINIPRTILYFSLVPIFGMTGAAVAFSLGSVIGLIVSLMVAKSIRMKIYWRSLALVLLIPIVFALVFSTLNVNFIIGIISTIIISYLLLMKLNIVEKSDGLFFIGLMPPKISTWILTISNRLEKVIDWFYG
jgi:O-antigen/teichoic acid export membrane protein